MTDRVKSPSNAGRRLAIGGASLLTLAGLCPLSVSAADSSATTSASGLVSNVTTALTGSVLGRGDYVSSGWAISLPGKHAATTVSLTKLVATIPLQCRAADQTISQVNLVIDLPDASVTIPANDTSWHPTSSSAAASGYEAVTQVDDTLCRGGSLTPHGKAAYTAKLVSTDTKDSFALRFHSVDARANTTTKQSYPNTDCSSTSANAKGVTQCNAAWTTVSSALASAAQATTGGGTGSGNGSGGQGSSGQGSSGGGSASGHVADTVKGVVNGITHAVNGSPSTFTGILNGVNGTVTAAVTGVTGKVAAALAPVDRAASSLLRPQNSSTGSTSDSGSSSSGAQPGAVSGTTAPSAPVLTLPAPSQSAVLGPVPLPVPVIDSVTAGVGGALPWRWFLLLAILDLGLIVGIVIRRRLAHRDRLRQQ